MRQVISKELVKRLLPQKKPFVMIEHLLAYSKTHITTGLTLTSDNLFIEEGGFNASGLLENIAQSMALHTSYSYYLDNKQPVIGYIGAINKVKVFKNPPVHGYITTKVDIIKEFMGITMVTGEIFSQKQLICKAAMKIFLTE